jgi:membrane protease YdiL (CAAX protease family)
MNQASETNPLRSNAVLALLLWAGYVAFVMGLWWLFGIDYAVIGQPGNVLLPLVIPIGGGGLLLALAVTRLGWWPSVMKETRPGQPRWMFWPLLGMFVFYVGQRLIGVHWSIEVLVPLISLIIGLACVGFSEELLHRGILVHGLRSGLPEIAA